MPVSTRLVLPWHPGRRPGRHFVPGWLCLMISPDLRSLHLACDSLGACRSFYDRYLFAATITRTLTIATLSQASRNRKSSRFWGASLPASTNCGLVHGQTPARALMTFLYASKSDNGRDCRPRDTASEVPRSSNIHAASGF